MFLTTIQQFAPPPDWSRYGCPSQRPISPVRVPAVPYRVRVLPIVSTQLPPSAHCTPRSTSYRVLACPTVLGFHAGLLNLLTRIDSPACPLPSVQCCLTCFTRTSPPALYVPYAPRPMLSVVVASLICSSSAHPGIRFAPGVDGLLHRRHSQSLSTTP